MYVEGSDGDKVYIDGVVGEALRLAKLHGNLGRLRTARCGKQIPSPRQCDFMERSLYVGRRCDDREVVQRRYFP